MPGWVFSWVLPIAFQAVSPFLVQSVKNGVAWLNGKLPDAVIVVLAGAISEGVNYLQGYLTSHPLPPGASGLLAVIINEVMTGLAGKNQLPAPVPAP